MYLVADFATMNNIQDYQSQIADKLKNVDVAMLYLNGASCQLGAFEDHTLAETERVFKVNAMHPVYLCKVLLGPMLARG